MVNGISIQKHPTATGAVLKKGDHRWLLVFAGSASFHQEMQVITDNEIGDAIHHGFSDDKAISYIEHQMAVAGYVIRILPHVAQDAAEWALDFLLAS